MATYPPYQTLLTNAKEIKVQSITSEAKHDKFVETDYVYEDILFVVNFTDDDDAVTSYMALADGETKFSDLPKFIDNSDLEARITALENAAE